MPISTLCVTIDTVSSYRYFALFRPAFPNRFGEPVRDCPQRRLNARILFLPPSHMGAIAPFVVLLIVALIFNYIPMDGGLKRIGYIVIGIVAILLLLRFAGIL